ncbi:MAG: hypothetical protein QOF10_5841 [Kribbellaceae bacterium]|nr:hypothetical protein [Kribbellaceae bacterium]
MSDNQLAVDVVRGEMQPWSDYSGKRGPVQGAVLRALLDDVLPEQARTLILGPHGADLVEAVVAKASETTLLVRSVSDAAELSEQFGDRLQVVAGALDGLAAADKPAFDVVVAADGLDRVLGYDSDDLDWSQRLDALAAVASPEAVLVLGLENEFSLTNLLDRRPADERHADDEWRPLHDDPSRPVSTDQLAASLARVGFESSVVYAAFSVEEAPFGLVTAEVAAAARPGQLPARLAVEALEASAVAVPLLAPIAEGAESAARAGLLGATPTGWIAVTGAVKHAIYAQTPGYPSVLTADAADNGWSVAVTAGTADAGSADLRFDAEAVPSAVPGGVTAEILLFRHAAAEDVPGFRDLAARLGDWARSQTGSQTLLRWDDVVVDGDSFAFGVSPWQTVAEESKKDLLAAAWQRFHDRLIGGHRRHPWPPWMVGDDLVSAWLAMSGIEAPKQVPATGPDTPSASVAQVARGKALAKALAAVVGIPADASQTPDVRTALADAERAKKESFELAGQVFGLERTLGFRDKALKTRETRIREMRTQVAKSNAERTRLRNSKAYSVVKLIRKVAMIRHPRKFAGKVKRKLNRQIRNKVG